MLSVKPARPSWWTPLRARLPGNQIMVALDPQPLKAAFVAPTLPDPGPLLGNVPFACSLACEHATRSCVCPLPFKPLTPYVQNW